MLPPSPTWTRRRFLAWSGSAAGALATWGGVGGFPSLAAPSPAGADPGVSDLPVGSAPEPLALPHFPSRVHAFVWRNWPLVPTRRMAALLGTTPRNVRRLGATMGLGRAPRIPQDQWRRSYLTILRRNWHLLPYDQLLALLGWSPSEMAYTLKEDDFLWVKLGNLKPRCAPLRWTPDLDQAAASPGNTLATVLRAELGPAFEGRWTSMFGFLPDLTGPFDPAAAPPARTDAGLRFCYSYFALYGDPLLEPELDPYPEGLLARLAAVGVTGVWLQGVLYKLARFPWQPDLSAGHEQRLANLASLVARARRHGIRVFLYLNEPRTMPLAFFERHPDLRGVTKDDHATLCTSHPPVQEYLADAVAGICRAVPDLGGFFTITASENLTSCWSHGGGRACPRCAPRGPAAVIAGVNATLQQGIDRAGGRQRLIAWDWGWGDDWAPDAIAQLPPSVSLMSVSEWSLPLRRGGVDSVVGEYSLSAVGPGPRAIRHWDLARKRGLQTFAKIQANNTWELSALPYLPVAGNVAQHATNLRRLNLDGVMLGWTLGGYPSPNLETIATVMAGGDLAEVARRRFGPDLAPAVLETWTACGEAYQEFPYHIGVVYTAPLQTGPANLLWPTPTGYAATMVGFAYDQLDAWRGPYPPEVFAAQLAKVAEGFARAAERLLATVEDNPSPEPAHRTAARVEATLARAASLHFRSVSNQARFVMLRTRLAAATTGPERQATLEALEPVLRDELRLARELFHLQSADARIGFEASNQYYYVPIDLAEKVLNCRHLLDHWLPAERQAATR